MVSTAPKLAQCSSMHALCWGNWHMDLQLTHYQPSLLPEAGWNKLRTRVRWGSHCMTVDCTGEDSEDNKYISKQGATKIMILWPREAQDNWWYQKTHYYLVLTISRQGAQMLMESRACPTEQPKDPSTGKGEVQCRAQSTSTLQNSRSLILQSIP